MEENIYMEESTNKKKMKKSIKILLIVAGVLIVAIAVLAYVNAQKTALMGSPGTLTFVSDGNILVKYSVEELKEFDSIDFEKTIESSKEDDESGTFTGIPLEKILDEVDSSWETKYKQFIFRAEDGFTTAVYASDLSERENVFVVYAKNGEDLKDRKSKGKGPLRIIVYNDIFGNRSAYYLTSIELK